MSLEQFKTQILLLHSQQRTLDTLSAGFSDRYSVHCATSGSEALLTLGDTPIHVIVSAQDLPGMSGLEALREAKKRSPDTIGILLAGTDENDGLEALVGDQAVFQIVRGEVEPADLINLIESANKRSRLIALAESANDQSANVDEPVTEHIVMETADNGSTIISDGTGRFPALKPEKIQITPGVGGRDVDVLVLTKDEEFLSTIKDSARGLHNVYHALTTSQANEFIGKHRIGVLVTDAAMADDGVESLTKRMRKNCPRLVAIVAGRRDDGEMLMDLINRGHVYRFLLKPVSPGRARLAIEASVKHHIEAPDEAFKPKSGPSFFARKDAKAEAEAKRKAEEKAKAEAEAKRKAEEKAKAEAKARREAEEKAKAEAKRKAEEEAKAKAEAERKAKEAKRKAEEEAKRKAEEEAKAKAEAERKAAEAKRKAEEEAKRKAEEEAKAKAEAERKAAEARRKAEEEAQRKAEEEAKRKAEEEAQRKAEEAARAKAEAAAREEAERIAREKAEAKALAKAEAAARKKEKAEAKARAKAEAKAEAEARAQAKAEAKARAKAEAEARKAASAKIEPVISDDSFDMPMDDNLDRAFAETNSFTDTMTDIAASVGKSVTGAAGSVAGGAHDILASLGETDSAWKKPKNMAIGGGAALALAIVGWFVMSGESTPEISDSGPAAVAKSPNVAPQAPPIQTSPAFEPPAATTTAPTTPDSGAAPYGTALERARAARDAGNLISPPESNAVELYVAAAAQAAGDPQVEAELQAVVDDVLGVAERAIMARNANEADTALDLARFADPGNSRLNFLTVQVNELLLRDRSDSARVAIRESRFEDAGRLIAEARGLAGADTVEVDLLTEELNTARSQQQVGETIATANARLEAGNLVTPANDNARYYFELALSNDPQNQAAQQGLITVASKLVLQARDAIDNDQLDAAEGLLDDASILDPSSAELSAAVTALTTKRNAVAEAARLAEAERVAALERQREATRQAERERVAEEQRQAVAAEQAELDAEQQANRAATASPLGVGAAAPKVEAPRSEPPVASRNSESSSSPSTSQSQAPSPPPIQRNTTPVVQASVNRQPPAPVQTQSASAVNVQGGSNLSGSVSAPQQVAMVPISQLTRINYVGPEYPRAARRRDVTGAVSVGFIVTTDGRVRSVSVISSEPGDTFDQAAMDAVEQWRFEPVIENGIAVEKRSAVRLAFNLQ